MRRIPLILTAALLATSCGSSSNTASSANQDPNGKPVPPTLTQTESGFRNPTVINDDLILLTGDKEFRAINRAGQTQTTFTLQGNEKFGARGIQRGEEYLLPLFNGGLIAVNKSGQEVARYAVNERFLSEPVVMADGTIVAAGLSGRIFFLTATLQLRSFTQVSVQYFSPANRGNTVVIPVQDFGVYIYRSDGVLIKELQRNLGAATGTVTKRDGSVVFGVLDGRIIKVSPDNTLSVTDGTTELSENPPAAYSTGGLSFTTTNGETLFLNEANQVIGKFKPTDEPVISTAVEVEPGIAAIVGLKAVYYVDVKTAQLIEATQLPIPKADSSFKPQWYVPGVLSDGTLVFSTKDAQFESKVYFLKRGQATR